MPHTNRDINHNLLNSRAHLSTLLFFATACVLVLMVFIFLVPGFPGNIFYNLHLISEFAAVVVAVYCYPGLRSSFMKWFLPFHVFIFLGESAIVYLVTVNKLVCVHIYYFIIMVVSVFYGYIYFHLSGQPSLKRTIKRITVVMVTIQVAAYGAYAIGWSPYLVPYLYSVSGLPICVIALLYLFERFRNDDLPITQLPGFWLTLGLCIFYSGISVVFMASVFLEIKHMVLFGAYLGDVVARLLCIVLYGCTCIAMFRYVDSKTKQHD